MIVHILIMISFILLYDTYKSLLSLLCLFQNVVPSVTSVIHHKINKYSKCSSEQLTILHSTCMWRNQNNVHVKSSKFDCGVHFLCLPFLRLHCIIERNSEILLPLVVNAFNLLFNFLYYKSSSWFNFFLNKYLLNKIFLCNDILS